MNTCKIDDVKKRLEKIEEVLADVAGGFLLARVPVKTQDIDLLTSIEVGINMILADLEQVTSERLDLTEQLEKLRGERK
jgi:hypothetical protein